MKKTVKKLLALSMAAVMAVGLASCSGSAETTTAADSKAKTQAEAKTEAQAGGGESQAGGAYTVTDPVEITSTTQDVGTTTYVYAPTMVNFFSDALPGSSVIDMTTVPLGGVGSPVILRNKQCNVTISNGAPAKWAAETDILGNSPTGNVRGLAGGLDKVILNAIFTQLFIDKTGITMIEELVAQKYPARITVKSSGTFKESVCDGVFKALGVSYEDIESWGGSVTQTSSDATVSLLKDGKADMAIDHVVPGQPATSELYMTAKMYSPQLSDDTLEKLTEKGFDYIVTPAGTWSGQEMEIKTVGSSQVILVSADLDGAIVYTTTKALCENTQTLVNASTALEVLGPETTREPIKLRAPIHPGAEAYYREMGYMKQTKLV